MMTMTREYECLNCGQDVPVEDVVRDSGQIDMVGTAHADTFCTHACLDSYTDRYDLTPLD